MNSRQIQIFYLIACRINIKKTIFNHIRVKLLKIKDQEKILTVATETKDVLPSKEQ